MENKIYWKKFTKPHTVRHILSLGDILLRVNGKLTFVFKFKIFTLETHPVAYVGIHKNFFKEESFKEIENINCHGGITFIRDNRKKKQRGFKELEKGYYWIGWDYTHLCLHDYNSLICKTTKKPPFKFKKYTTLEISNECFKVIRQLERILKIKISGVGKNRN